MDGDDGHAVEYLVNRCRDVVITAIIASFPPLYGVRLKEVFFS